MPRKPPSRVPYEARTYGVRSAEAPAERVSWDQNVYNKTVLTSEIIADGATIKKFTTVAEFDFWDGASYGPSASPASTSDPVTRYQDIELDLTEAAAGDGVILFHDYDLVVKGGAFDWASIVEELYRYGQTVSAPAVGATSSGKTQLLRSRPWLQGGSAGKVLAPGATTSGGGEIPILRSGIYTDTLPGSGDADYDATGYTYLLRIRTFPSAELSGTEPFENAQDTAGRTFLSRDLNLVAAVLRVTGS